MTTPSPTPHRYDRDAQQAYGRSLRQHVPRSSHQTWHVVQQRSEPLDRLLAQDQGRLPDLLPIKYGRMMASPFAYLRGSGMMMTSDLAETPATTLDVLLCGDAHLTNFGFFASPERNLVFDINDFDACHTGSWEWDLKRLAVSIVVAGREQHFDDDTLRDIVTEMTSMYRKGIKRMDRWSTLDVWYHYIDSDVLIDLYDEWANRKSLRALQKTIDKALTQTQDATVDKLTSRKDGTLQFKHEPPLLVPVRADLLSAEVASVDQLTQQWQVYLDNLEDDQRFLLSRYRVADVALRVGGIDSIGLRTFVVLLQGEGENDYLVLQLKQADDGKRIVIGQRRIQATPDIFLGWHQDNVRGHAYYWRQFKDMKATLNLSKLNRHGFAAHTDACALVLARAHARTGDEAAIRGYLGKSENFDKSIATFALAYGNQIDADYAMFLKAINNGKIIAEAGR